MKGRTLTLLRGWLQAHTLAHTAAMLDQGQLGGDRGGSSAAECFPDVNLTPGFTHIGFGTGYRALHVGCINTA